MFELENLRVAFGRNLALSVESATFEAGSAVSLMGPNGAGKTTLLAVLAGLLPATSGRITATPATASPKSNPLKSNPPGSKPPVGYVAQEAQQMVSLTAGEIIKMGRYRQRGLLGRLRKSDRELLDAVAHRLRVADLLTQPFGNLSGGQRQRVRVAAALANDADCLLLDEPITGLDLPSQEIIFEVIASERSKGRLVVMSTHNIDEASRCDRVLLLNTTVIADATPAEALTEPNLRAAFGERLVSVVPAPAVDPAITQASTPALALLDGHGHTHDHAHTNQDDTVRQTEERESELATG